MNIGLHLNETTYFCYQYNYNWANFNSKFNMSKKKFKNLYYKDYTKLSI